MCFLDSWFDDFLLCGQLHVVVFGLDFVGGVVVEPGMESAVVGPFDIVHDGSAGVVSGGEFMVVEPFVLQYGVMVVHGPADHFFRVAVDDGRQVQPAFVGGDVGDITEEFLTRRGR